MTDQWLELNGEIYAVLVRKAKKMPRYKPGRMYQGVSLLKQARRNVEKAICRARAWWRQ